MGKNKNKKNKQNNSAGWNKFGYGPFNNKFKQDKPNNKNGPGQFNKFKQDKPMNKEDQGMKNGGKFVEKRIMNEKSAASMKDKPINKENNQGIKKDKGAINGGEPLTTFSMKKDLVQDKDSPDKKKVKFQTSSDSSLEGVEVNQATKKDVNNQQNKNDKGGQLKRLGSYRETPSTKKIKLDSSKEIDPKKIKFDENGSFDDSDMEDDSDLEDEDDSLMDEEEDMFDEEEDDDESIIDSSAEGLKKVQTPQLDKNTKNDSTAKDDAPTLDGQINKLTNLLDTLSQNIQSATLLFNNCVQLMRQKNKE